MDHGGVDSNGTTVVLCGCGPPWSTWRVLRLCVQHQLKVRFPEDLKQWLEEQAKSNRRSQSAEIVFRLAKERALQEEENASNEKAPAFADVGAQM